MENNNKTFFADVKRSDSQIGFGDLFKNVFKTHTGEEMDRVLTSGTHLNKPERSDLLSGWQRPWVFSRVLLWGVIAYLLVLATSSVLESFYAIGVGSSILINIITVPMAMLILFFELNIPRNIPLHKIIAFAVIGGVLCEIVNIVTTLLLGVDMSKFGLVNASDAIIPGITEELTKLIVILVILRDKKYCYGINGMLVGAAVGTGFAVFESAGYVANYLIQYGFDTGLTVAVDRGLNSIAGHIVWAAIIGCAVALIKGDKDYDIHKFFQPLFLLPFFSSVVLHFLWDASCVDKVRIAASKSVWGTNLYKLFDQFYFRPLVFAVVEFFILRWLLKKCYSQVMAVQQHELNRPNMDFVNNPAPAPIQNAMPVNSNAPASASSYRVECIAGECKGSVFSVTQFKPVVFGRGDDCVVRFAPDTKGISGHHCCVGIDQNGLFLEDLGSSYGTFTANGQKLTPNVKVRLNAGDCFMLASDHCKFRVL